MIETGGRWKMNDERWILAKGGRWTTDEGRWTTVKGGWRLLEEKQRREGRGERGAGYRVTPSMRFTMSEKIRDSKSTAETMSGLLYLRQTLDLMAGADTVSISAFKSGNQTEPKGIANPIILSKGLPGRKKPRFRWPNDTKQRWKAMIGSPKWSKKN